MTRNLDDAANAASLTPYFAGERYAGRNECQQNLAATHSDMEAAYAPFSGILPTRTYSFFAIDDAGNAVVFQANDSYPNGVEFTAMKYAFTPTYNPANTPKTFQLPTGGVGTNLLTFRYTTSATSDPGHLVTLAATIPLMAGDQGTPGNVNISWLSKLRKR
jgi:hypothetical protein